MYDFDCGAYVLTPGDQVMVETEQGLSLGTVVAAPKVLEEPPAHQVFKKMFRLAALKDWEQLERKAADERSAARARPQVHPGTGPQDEPVRGGKVF